MSGTPLQKKKRNKATFTLCILFEIRTIRQTGVIVVLKDKRLMSICLKTNYPEKMS